MGAAFAFAVLALLAVWTVYQVIRIGVRYGVNDALRMNKEWLRPDAMSERAAREEIDT
jgi:hypothetical protein